MFRKILKRQAAPSYGAARRVAVRVAALSPPSTFGQRAFLPGRGRSQCTVPSLRRLTLALAATLLVLAAHPAAGLAACANPVACENEKPGTAPSVWQGATDSTIQGYATSMSVNVGGTIRFKVKTNASRYHLDIYRLGYYQGNGARLQQGNVQPTASLPQSQPACLTDSSTGLIDCGNWGLSASWTVPSNGRL